MKKLILCFGAYWWLLNNKHRGIEKHEKIMKKIVHKVIKLMRYPFMKLDILKKITQCLSCVNYSTHTRLIARRDNTTIIQIYFTI